MGESEEKARKEGFKITDLPGIGQVIASKLEAAGITELMNIAVLSPAELSDTAGVSEAVARKAIQASRKMLNLDFEDASEYMKKKHENKS